LLNLIRFLSAQLSSLSNDDGVWVRVGPGRAQICVSRFLRPPFSRADSHGPKTPGINQVCSEPLPLRGAGSASAARAAESSQAAFPPREARFEGFEPPPRVLKAGGVGWS